MTRLKFIALAAIGLLASTSATAQTTRGYGTIIRMPIVASTASNATTLFVHNPQGTDTLIQFTYYGASGTALPGARSCGARTVPAGQTVQYNINTICSLGGGSNFGQMELHELEAENKPFAAYTRVQQPSGDGFSIEGFPVGAFSNPSGTSYVTGLRRQAAAPGYASNCFVGALGEAVTVNISLQAGDGTSIGSPANYVVPANDIVRLLDVFATLGAPAGDYSNVRASFFENGLSEEPAFVAFCTTENKVTFDSDFRIAKDASPADDRSRFIAASTTSGMGAALTLTGFSEQNVFGLYLQHPDWVQCTATGAQAAGIELRLKDPSGIVLVGGDGISSFGETYLGEKNARNSGVNGLWTLEVEASGLNAISPPVTYGVTCRSGNGSNRPLLIGTKAFQEF